MKIKVKVPSHTTKEIDVEFPCFIKYGDVFDSGGGYDTYVRYEANGTHVSITQRHNNIGEESWEFESQDNPARVDLKADLGYHIVEQGDRRCEPKEFYDKLDELIAALQSVLR